MNCPICQVALVLSEKQGIEIDYCPKCRGIWLDRGELDKIIERSAPIESQSKYNAPYDPYKSHSHDSYRHHKQKNWLSDLFD
jgi:Zn-finger nucleic acid-binding protein